MAWSEKGNFGNRAGEPPHFASAISELEAADKGNQKVIKDDLITFLKGNFSALPTPAHSKTYGER
jgi:hypothetical protein